MELTSIEDQTRNGSSRGPGRGAAVTPGLLPWGFTPRGFAPWGFALLGLALAAAGCAAPHEWRAAEATRPDQRRPQEYCVRPGDGIFTGRVVNFQDPELCERWVKERGPYFVRVSRPPTRETPQDRKSRAALEREARR